MKSSKSELSGWRFLSHCRNGVDACSCFLGTVVSRWFKLLKPLLISAVCGRKNAEAGVGMEKWGCVVLQQRNGEIQSDPTFQGAQKDYWLRFHSGVCSKVKWQHEKIHLGAGAVDLHVKLLPASLSFHMGTCPRPICSSSDTAPCQLAWGNQKTAQVFRLLPPTCRPWKKLLASGWPDLALKPSGVWTNKQNISPSSSLSSLSL